MPDTNSPSPFQRLGSRKSAVMAAVALLAVGGGAGAVAMQATRPTVSMAPANPVAIRSLSSSGIVTIRGRVAEVYGNKFIMADATGKALVETGREGEDGHLVTVGEPVTVQGRLDRGFLHAAFLVGPDSKVVALGPLGGPPHGPRGPCHGPDDGPDAPPAPPPGSDVAGNAPPPAPASAPAPAANGTAASPLASAPAQR